MRVKMITTMCGPAGNFNAGQVADFDDEQGQALLDGGYAEPVAVPNAPPPPAVDESAPEPVQEAVAVPAPARGKRGRNAA